MTRNQIIKRAGELEDKLWNSNRGTYGTAVAVSLGHFSNDLCNSPTKRNMKMGAVTYTVKMATKKLREYEAIVTKELKELQ